MDEAKGPRTTTFALPAIFAALRRDLASAQEHLLAEGGQPLMVLSGAEIELEVTFERETSGSGDVCVKVFGVGAESTIDRRKMDKSTHRMKILLAPVGETGLLGSDG